MASILPAKSQELDDTCMLSCLLCTQSLRTDERPVSFPICAHTFCSDCLYNHHIQQICCAGSAPVATALKLENYPNVRCPVCVDGDPISGANLSKIPFSHRVHDLFYNVKITKNKHGHVNKCDWCPDNPKIRRHKPRKRCLKCKVNLCEKCHNLHHQSHGQNSEHIVVRTSGHELKLTCRKHKKAVEHHCKQCSSLICGSCSMDRRGHLDHRIQPLKDVCTEQTVNLRERLEKIQTLINEKQKQKRDAADLMKKQKQEFQKTKQDILRNLKGLINSIEKMGKGLVDDLENFSEAAQTLYDNHNSYLDYTIHQLHRLQFFVQEMSQAGREPTVLLHADDVDQHLDWFTSNRHMKEKNKKALDKFRQIPKFDLDVQIINHQVRKLGNINFMENQDIFETDASPYPVDFVSLPKATLHYESETTTGANPPSGLFFTSKGTLLVAEYSQRQIATHDLVEKAKKLEVIKETKNFFPSKLTSDGQLLYVTDDNEKCIKTFDNTGNLHSRLGLFSSPSGIALSTDLSYLVVTDRLDHCVYILNKKDGTVKRKFGRQGSKEKEFKVPEFVTVADDDHILVSDRGNHRVCVYNMKGDLVKTFGSHGSGPNEFDTPMGICTDEYGNILVVDCNNQRVCRFDSKGNYIDNVLTFTKGSTKPYGIAISRDGYIAISDNCTLKIMVFKVYDYGD